VTDLRGKTKPYTISPYTEMLKGKDFTGSLCKIVTLNQTNKFRKEVGKIE